MVKFCNFGKYPFDTGGDKIFDGMFHPLIRYVFIETNKTSLNQKKKVSLCSIATPGQYMNSESHNSETKYPAGYGSNTWKYMTLFKAQN